MYYLKFFYDIFFNTDRPISDVAFVINAVDNEKLSSLFKRIFAVWVSKEQGYYFEAMSLLYRIFSEIKKENRSPKRHSDKIAPAISLIHTEFLKKRFLLKSLRPHPVCANHIFKGSLRKSTAFLQRDI